MSVLVDCEACNVTHEAGEGTFYCASCRGFDDDLLGDLTAALKGLFKAHRSAGPHPVHSCDMCIRAQAALDRAGEPV